MKELTLEQWCAYLPHKINAEILDYKSDYVGKQYDTIIGVNQWSKCGKRWSFETSGGAKHSADRIKPILRPLTDLTKEIEVNGEKFVPIERLKELYFESTEIENGGIFLEELVYKNNEFKSYIQDIRYTSDSIHKYHNPIGYNTSINIYNKLLSWHFNVFNLPENLYIDINTLKQPKTDI